jgi:hypothetical protein
MPLYQNRHAALSIPLFIIGISTFFLLNLALSDVGSQLRKYHQWLVGWQPFKDLVAITGQMRSTEEAISLYCKNTTLERKERMRAGA